MKVAKEFRWEGAHRLPWHTGGCQNLHGHSYRMTVVLDGPTDDRGMVIDFKEIKAILKPLIEEWDHATLVADYDEKLLEAVKLLESKHSVLPYDTTSENMCDFVISRLRTEGLARLTQLGIGTITVQIRETETCYAELTVPLLELAEAGDGAARELADLDVS